MPLPRTPVNKGKKKDRGPAGPQIYCAVRCLRSLAAGLPQFRDHPKLLRHAQGVEVGPGFHYLAFGEPQGGNPRYLHPLACRGTKCLRITLVGTTAPRATCNELGL
jgi:hypothetical protein